MRLLAKLVGLAVLIAVVLVALVVARVDPPGCRLFSVDEDSWVAANRELLDGLPVYPGSTLMYESSEGWRVAKDRCFSFENSGPYDSYGIFRRYDMPDGSKFADVVAYYRDRLRNGGWVAYSRAGSLEYSYTRGDAFFTIRSAQGEMFWEFVVNHDGR